MDRPYEDDPEWFTTYVREWEPNVLIWCSQKISDKQAAEDARQEVFLRACEALRNGEEVKSHGAWLRAIANNVCNTKLSRRNEVELADPTHVAKMPCGSPPDKLDYRMEPLFAALDRLTEDQRRVLEMKYLEGKSHQDIAQELDMSDSHVGVLVHRAKKELKKILNREG
jgi:RNA polymerase sigma-70 factor (ECF subfamily)